MKKIFLIIGLLSGMLFAGCGSEQDGNEPTDALPTTNVEEEQGTGNESDTEELTGEDSKESTSAEENGNADTYATWADYSITVNGYTVSLPCSYAELAEATGFSMTSTDSERVLEADSWTECMLFADDGDKQALYIKIVSDIAADTVYADCKVVEVTQSDYEVSTGVSIVTFPGNVFAGMPISGDELIALFGEPTKLSEYESDTTDYWSKTYKWCENRTSTNYYEVEIVNDVVDEVTLNHEDY